MPEIRKISEFNSESAFTKITLERGASMFLKLEGLNASGSIKLKAARAMIEALETQGKISSNTRLIESSSGSLGVALSMIAAERGYKFTCVVDPNISPQNLKTMIALGAKIKKVSKRDKFGGFLGSRIDLIKEIIANNRNAYWLNQYANPANPQAHEQGTALEIDFAFPDIDFLFIGAGTTGTLMGCRDYFSQYKPKTKIIAVDSIGSITFGGKAGPRRLPGLGTSRVPEIFTSTGIHEFLYVPELETIKVCRRIAKTHGFLPGCSTGTVLAAIENWPREITADTTVVAISPDFGERYLDTLYDDQWVLKHFGATSDELNQPVWISDNADFRNSAHI